MRIQIRQPLIGSALVIMASGLLQLCCTPNLQNSNLQGLIGKQIIVSDSLWQTLQGGETTVFPPVSSGLAAKILVYYNAQGCTPCKLKELPLWHNLRGERLF